MIRYFNEEDEENINVDVQVGPNREVNVQADPDEAVPGHKEENDNDVKGIVNPVAIAKASADSIPVAAIPCDNGCKYEFYVDIDDVATFANLNEYTCVEAINAIIENFEDMTADNLFICCRESDMEYAQKIDEAGGNCIVYENDDIHVDVQVGPNGEEMDQSADPQEANPVDAVKRNYDNVVAAFKDGNFFTDVEDVQKCANLNCESVIDTLNGIIAANEDAGMNADNLIVVGTRESFSEAAQEEFDASHVMYCFDE